MRSTDIAIAIVVQILWAMGFTLGKPVVAHFPPLMMMAMVYAVTAVCLARYVPRVTTPFWRLFLLTAFVAPIQAFLIFSGLKGLPASIAILVLQLQAPFSVLFGWILLGERPSLLRLAGMLVSFLGVAIVAGAPEAASSWWPVLLVAAGSAFWSAGQAAARGKVRDAGPTLTAGIAINAIPQALLASVLFERGQLGALASASLGMWLTFAAFALAGFVIAYSLWYGLLARYRVDQVIPFTLLMPIAGVIAGGALLGERISAMELLGGAVILAGLWVVVRSQAPRALPGAACP
ncbi:MAG TPA: EamA family transporter [Dongiaceae bacterium]|nr:EamA family transporter [Dongiaceae bacterium]